MGRPDKGAPSPTTGILVLDKPVGMTSMDAVAAVRRKAGGVRTGHAGTLDPLASGVLVLALGPATRHLERFMATDKRYRTVVDLSAFTTTDDLEGDRMEVEVPAPPAEALVRTVLERFAGSIMQRPPAYSAVKVGGRRAYRLARRGQKIDLPAREVMVHRIELLCYHWPCLELDVHCGHGTYIRTLARDIGEALETGGHCQSLRRTAVGPFTEVHSRQLDDLPEPITEVDLLPLAQALAKVTKEPEG